MSHSAIVQSIRQAQCLGIEIPEFDPHNGNEQARFLFLLEAPGPQALKTGIVSFDNPDQTARNFRAQLAEAGIDRQDIAIWNVVPWYLGNAERTRIKGAAASDVRLGFDVLVEVVHAIEGLRCIVLVGGAARQVHIRLSQVTTARILSCHHPSPRCMNANPAAWAENVAVFRFMRETALPAGSGRYCAESHSRDPSPFPSDGPPLPPTT